jgi:2-polyprenyl-3-methyl-5-hydroxy-6-metoxy-1,4-benzoquinol methylase
MISFPDIYEHFIIDEKDKHIISTFILRYAYGKTLLDIGCGTGWLSHMLAKSGFIIDACDHDDRMLNYAQTQHSHENIQYFNADMLQLTTEKAYDTILIMTDGLNYLSNTPLLKQVLTKCESLLNSPGRLIFDVYDPSVLDIFSEEHLEEKRVLDTDVQWAIQSCDQQISHYIRLNHMNEKHETHHFIQTVFDDDTIDEILNSMNFKVRKLYDFNEKKKQGIKRVYIAEKP